MNIFSLIQKPFMVYGFYNRVINKFHKNTRIGSTSKLICKAKLNMGDNIWIGHYCLLDASNGLDIGKGDAEFGYKMPLPKRDANSRYLQIFRRR